MRQKGLDKFRSECRVYYATLCIVIDLLTLVLATHAPKHQSQTASVLLFCENLSPCT